MSKFCERDYSSIFVDPEDVEALSNTLFQVASGVFGDQFLRIPAAEYLKSFDIVGVDIANGRELPGDALGGDEITGELDFVVTPKLSRKGYYFVECYRISATAFTPSVYEGYRLGATNRYEIFPNLLQMSHRLDAYLFSLDEDDRIVIPLDDDGAKYVPTLAISAESEAVFGGIVDETEVVTYMDDIVFICNCLKWVGCLSGDEGQK